MFRTLMRTDAKQWATLPLRIALGIFLAHGVSRNSSASLEARGSWESPPL